MNIAINIDKYLLCNMFNISYKKITDEYSGMSIEEIMQAEAKQGNAAAAKFDQSILSDPAKLIQFFELNDPSNKYAILSNMNQEDLNNLLPMLNQQDLVQGLNFFNKDKLLNMFAEMPKEELLKLTFEMFSDAHVMQMMPEDQLNKMLMSTDMDKNQEIEYLQTIKPEIMAQMLEAATGEAAPGSDNVGLDGQPQYDMAQMMNQFKTMDDAKFQDAMLSIPKESKQAFLYKLAGENPKLYKDVDAQTYLGMMNEKKDKPDILRSVNVIDKKYLVKMVSKLPKELTSIVLTQMDTNQFASVLINRFKDVLKQITAN